MTNRFAILSPYLVPPWMRKKKVNLGDGFILHAIERQVGPFKKANIFTSRVAPDPIALDSLRSAKAILLGGANQLDDRFSVWPGATAADIRASSAPFVPFAIGLNGEPERNAALSDNTCEVIEAIHEQIEFSSWRCGRTVALAQRCFSAPHRPLPHDRMPGAL